MLMLKELINRYAKPLSAGLLLAGLAGCGSGGGNDNILCGGNPCPSPGQSGGSSSNNQVRLGSGSGTNFNAGVLTASIGSASLPPSGNTTISASIVDQTGAFVTNESTITFSSRCNTEGSASFNQNQVITTTGQAQVTYTAEGCEGSDTITATLGTATASVEITVSPNVVRIGRGSGADFVAGELTTNLATGTSLSAGGQIVINMSLANQQGVLQTANASNPLSIEVTSGCITRGLAKVDRSPVTTVTGTASVVYTDMGCGVAPNGTSDTIVASALNSSASVDVTIAPDTVNQLQFISAQPQELFLKGTGGVETSVVTFSVRGQLGGPVVGATVDFELSTDVGGIEIPVTSGVTNAQGQVSATVQAGTVPTSVRVIATERSSMISTVSNSLSVATGITDSDNFSVVAQTLNPECWSGVQGNQVTITAFLGDVFNNPPPNGTVVQFITEGGIIGSSCQSSGGRCTVTFTCTPEFVSDGRIEILGYTIGAESFDDVNTNGVFDAGDRFVAADNDLSEAFRDDNEDGVYNDIQYLDFNSDGAFNDKDGKYTGPNCDSPNDGTECAIVGGEQVTTLNVFNSVTISQSNPTVTRIFGGEAVPGTERRDRAGNVVQAAQTFVNRFFGGNASQIFSLAGGSQIRVLPNTSVNLGTLIIGDSNLNSLPTGTTIAVTAGNGELASGNGFTIRNTNRPAFIPLAIRADDEPSNDGNLQVTITVPGYGAEVFSWPVNDSNP